MSEIKISDLDAVSSVDHDDLAVSVIDLTSNGTKKITIGNLAKSLISQDSDNLLEDDTNGLIKADADNFISSDADNLVKKGTDEKLLVDPNDITDLPSLTINELLQIDKILSIPPTIQTISSGEIDFEYSHILLKGEGDVADTLTTINGGTAGQILIISFSNAYRITVTYGLATIDLENELDARFENGDRLVLLCSVAGNWKELCRKSRDSFRTGTGYEYLPNNRLRQYGKYTGAAHGPTITFPISFDTLKTISAICKGVQGLVSYNNESTTSVDFFQANTAGATLTNDFYWKATGTKAQ